MYTIENTLQEIYTLVQGKEELSNIQDVVEKEWCKHAIPYSKYYEYNRHSIDYIREHITPFDTKTVQEIRNILEEYGGKFKQIQLSKLLASATNTKNTLRIPYTTEVVPWDDTVRIKYDSLDRLCLLLHCSYDQIEKNSVPGYQLTPQKNGILRITGEIEKILVPVLSWDEQHVITKEAEEKIRVALGLPEVKY